jgi:Fe-S cluster biogenesis protein NfuA
MTETSQLPGALPMVEVAGDAGAPPSWRAETGAATPRRTGQATHADAVARERIGQVERLLEAVEGLPDAAARDTATELAQALLGLYGEGLERIVEVLAQNDDGALARALADDELVAHLLLVHGLHPVAVENRVRDALATVMPYLESHGGSVQLLGIDEGVVRLRLQGSCSGCPSSALTLKSAIEEAIFKFAPDVEEVRAEGAVEPVAAPSGLLQIECPSALRAVGA